MKKNKINISRIAKELNMSPSTVSRALSGSGRISEITRIRVNDYLTQNDLVPNTRKKRYSDTITQMISVVLPGESDFAKIPYFSNVLYSVYDYFSIRGYQINLIKISPDDISNLKKGHKVNQLRLDGILRAHMQSHMYLDKNLIFYDTESEIIAEMAIEKSLEANVDCILCMDDNICIKIIRILKKKGLHIPDDIKIASLHNSELLDEFDPSISCIYQNEAELGKEASRILYTYLNEGKILTNSILGYELQMKDSTN